MNKQPRWPRHRVSFTKIKGKTVSHKNELKSWTNIHIEVTDAKQWYFLISTKFFEMLLKAASIPAVLLWMCDISAQMILLDDNVTL